MDSRRAGGGNRMMTSTTLQTNDIWSKTIGHDPHAGDAEAAEDAAARERQEERARGVMELARLDAIKQGGSSRGDSQPIATNGAPMSSAARNPAAPPAARM